MQKQIFLYLFIITIILFSCNSKEQKDNFKHVVYRAINNKDTATLSIHIILMRNVSSVIMKYHVTGLVKILVMSGEI